MLRANLSLYVRASNPETEKSCTLEMVKDRTHPCAARGEVVAVSFGTVRNGRCREKDLLKCMVNGFKKEMANKGIESTDLYNALLVFEQNGGQRLSLKLPNDVLCGGELVLV